MAYIGKSPQVGNYIKLDAISCTSNNTYNLTKDSVAFTPESALHMMVSLNGVIQAPLTSFSVSGTSITFLPSSGTLSSSDTIDFILVLGNVLDIGTPSDSTVTNAKTNFVSTSLASGLQIKGDNTTAGTLQLNCEQNSHGIKLRSPAHTHNQSYTLTFPTTAPVADKALITDGSGNLSFGSAGSRVLLRSVTISSNTNSVDFVHGSNNVVLDSTYSRYEITIDSAISTTEAQLNLYLSSNGGSSYFGDSAYNSAYHRHYTNGSSTGNDSAYVNDFALNHDQGTSATANRGGATGTIIVDSLGTAARTVFNGQFFGFGHSNYYIHTNSIGTVESNGDIYNALRIKFRTGDIASGIFKIYGVV